MNKGSLKVIVGGMALMTSLTGCNMQNYGELREESITEESTKTASEEESIETVSTDASTEDNVVEEKEGVSDYDSTEMMAGESLSDEELDKFRDFLMQDDNNGFTMSSYRTPDKIDWGQVFYSGAGIKNCDYSQDALDAYFKADEDFDSVEYDLIALSGDDVRAFVKAKTGITDFDVSTVSGYTYVEEYDILFTQRSDINRTEVFCEKGVRNGDQIQIAISIGMYDRTRRITLVETNDADNPYQFVSNRELWEESADKIIEARNYDTDKTVTCAITNSNGRLAIEVIEDNSVAVEVFPTFKKADKDYLKQYTEVKEIALGDADGDKLTDMVVILSSGNSDIALLCRGFVNEDGEFVYAIGEKPVTELISSKVSDITADNVVGFLKEHRGEY